LVPIEEIVLSHSFQLSAKWKKYAELPGTLVAQVRNLRDSEKKFRVKVRESESELDILKRRYMFFNMSAELTWTLLIFFAI